MRYAFSAFLCLALAALAFAEPLAIEGKTSVPQYGMADLKAVLKDSSKNTSYRWKVISGEPVSVVRMGDRLLFSGPPGKYRISVTVVDFDSKIFDENEIIVTIEGTPPKPPEPKPPEPKPPEPVPDALVKALKNAYLADVSPERNKHLEALSRLYKMAAEMKVADKVDTAGELYAKLIEASRALLPSTALPAVRKVIAAELKAVLPGTTDSELSSEHRKQAHALFARLGVALTEAGK